MSHDCKIALVTGGSRGLGKDISIELAKSGKDVILTYQKNEKLAHQVVDEINKLGRKAVALKLDMANFSEVSPFVEKLKVTLSEVWNKNKIDFLINNAGMGSSVPMEKVTEEIFDEFLNVHFKSVYFLTQKILTFMNEDSRVINVSSGTTRFSNPGYSVYASMKGAMEVLTRYIAKEYGCKGIGCNIVAPGPVETDFNNANVRNNSQVKSVLSSLSPLNRVGVPEDIGGVVAFLCTEQARWINGQRIEVSGGINT